MRHLRLVAIAVLALSGTACSGSSDSGARASTSPSASGSPAPTASFAAFDPNVRLTQTYRTTIFQPPLIVKLPADWYPTERDAAAFQMYAGDEDYEITFDHTYTRKESVADAIARLKKTEGIEAGPVSPVSIGGRAGLAFVASRPGVLRLTFPDSGYHVPGGSDLEVMAIPLQDGTTLSVFVTRRVGDGISRSLEATRQVARRIMATVQWR